MQLIGRILLTLVGIAALLYCLQWLLDPTHDNRWQAAVGILGWVSALMSIWRKREQPEP